MTKIMLVEDDNNLREIYEARLAAEGFAIVAAQDGEAALALAAKEHPDLVITDVMMPKISGFEMLDILRNTEALRDVKVIMLTALGQAEDNARAGALGADRYLVKSQVTLEDIVKAAHEVIDGPADAETKDSAAYLAASGLTSEPTGQPAAASASDTPSDNQIPGLDFAMPAAPIEPAAPSTPADQAAPVEQPASTEQPAPATPPALATTPASDAPASDDTTATADSSSTNAASDGNPTSDSTLADNGDPAAAAAPLATTPLDPMQPFTPAADAVTEPAVVNAEAAEEVTAAPSAEEEESSMHAQIDEFLKQQPPEPITSALAAVPASGSDEASADATQAEPETTSGLPDEDEAEFAKDDSVPDMGILDVQPEPAAQPDAPAAQPAAASFAGENPQTDQQPAAFGGQADASQANGDRIVSDAINTMIAGAPQAPVAAPVTPQVQTIPLPDVPVAGNTTPEQAASAGFGSAPAAGQTSTPDVPSAPAPGAQPAPDSANPAAAASQSYAGHFSGRVIAPVDSMEKPDIHQLLALEDAKNAATQAGQQPAAPAPAPNQPPAVNPYPSLAQTTPGIDPNSISL